MDAQDIELLKSNVVKPSSDFMKQMDSRYTVVEYSSLDTSTVFYRDEKIIINGEERTVRRLFVQKDGSTDGSRTVVGWVINEDINECMICAIPFGMFRYRHHCRSCGNLVCYTCSPNEVVLHELRELGPVRVCVQCYWGQDPVYVAYNFQSDSGRNSYSDSLYNGKEIEFYTNLPGTKTNSDYYDGNSIVKSDANSEEYHSFRDEFPKKKNEGYNNISTIHMHMRREVIVPVPVFCISTHRISEEDSTETDDNSSDSVRSSTKKRSADPCTIQVFVNICQHSKVMEVAGDSGFIVCDYVNVAVADEISTSGSSKNTHFSRTEKRVSRKSEKLETDVCGYEDIEFEVYTVVCRPEMLQAYLVVDVPSAEKILNGKTPETIEMRKVG